MYGTKCNWLLLLLLSLLHAEVSSMRRWSEETSVFSRDSMHTAVTLVMMWAPGACTSVIGDDSYTPHCRIENLRPFWIIKQFRGFGSDCGPVTAQVPYGLRSDLNQLWPSISHSQSSFVAFWAHHYRKDGSCLRTNPLLNSPFRFFSSAVYVARRADLLVGLAKAGYVPTNKAYHGGQLKKALDAVHGARVRMRCPRRRDFLEQVELCFDYLLRPSHCKQDLYREECAPQLFYLPPPPPSTDTMSAVSEADQSTSNFQAAFPDTGLPAQTPLPSQSGFTNTGFPTASSFGASSVPTGFTTPTESAPRCKTGTYVPGELTITNPNLRLNSIQGNPLFQNGRTPVISGFRTGSTSQTLSGFQSNSTFQPNSAAQTTSFLPFNTLSRNDFPLRAGALFQNGSMFPPGSLFRSSRLFQTTTPGIDDRTIMSHNPMMLTPQNTAIQNMPRRGLPIRGPLNLDQGFMSQGAPCAPFGSSPFQNQLLSCHGNLRGFGAGVGVPGIVPPLRPLGKMDAKMVAEVLTLSQIDATSVQAGKTRSDNTVSTQADVSPDATITAHDATITAPTQRDEGGTSQPTVVGTDMATTSPPMKAEKKKKLALKSFYDDKQGGACTNGPTPAPLTSMGAKANDEAPPQMTFFYDNKLQQQQVLGANCVTGLSQVNADANQGMAAGQANVGNLQGQGPFVQGQPQFGQVQGFLGQPQAAFGQAQGTLQMQGQMPMGQGQMQLGQPQMPLAQGQIPIGQGQIPMGQGQVPMGQGQVPMGQGQVPLTQGQVPMGQGQVPLTQGQVPMGQGQIPLGQGQVPLAQGQMPLAQGQVPMGQGQVPLAQGQMPLAQGQVPMGQGQVPMGQGQVPMGQGQIPFAQGQPVQGQALFNQGPNGQPQNIFAQGQPQTPFGQPQNVQGQVPFGQGQTGQAPNLFGPGQTNMNSIQNLFGQPQPPVQTGPDQGQAVGQQPQGAPAPTWGTQDGQTPFKAFYALENQQQQQPVLGTTCTTNQTLPTGGAGQPGQPQPGFFGYTAQPQLLGMTGQAQPTLNPAQAFTNPTQNTAESAQTPADQAMSSPAGRPTDDTDAATKGS